MIEELININNETPSTRLLSLGNPNVEVPKQAIKQANNHERNVYYLFLSNFPKLTSTFNATLPPKHSVRHHICTNDPPIYSTQRRFSLEILKQVRTKFYSMLQVGIISLTNSKWASPLHMVKKSEGPYRPCGNY